VIATMVVASAVDGNRAAIESAHLDSALATQITAAFITGGIENALTHLNPSTADPK